MTLKILLLEDEKNLGASLSEFLNDNYGLCLWAQSIEQAKELTSKNIFQFALLDIGLPDGSGIDFAKELKGKHGNIKLLFLSAQNDPTIKVQGLETGLDYITKPFALKELTLRLDRIIDQSVDHYVFGKLEIRPESYEIVYADGQIETLNQKEMGILNLLLENKNEALSRDKIIAKVWGEDIYPSNRTVDNYIVKFRRWCESDPQSGLEISSVRGVGYKLKTKER